MEPGGVSPPKSTSSWVGKFCAISFPGMDLKVMLSVDNFRIGIPLPGYQVISVIKPKQTTKYS